MRHRLYVAAVLGLVLCALPAETAGQDPEIRLPLPLVTRVKPLSEASVFERPAIVLAGRLSERAEVWVAPHVSGLPVKFPVETRLYFGVETIWVIRVNERGPLDPDLANIGFRFQIAPDHAVAWEPKIGALYVLLLDTPQYSLHHSHHHSPSDRL